MQQDMTRGPILSQILKFTLPLFIGNMFQQFYNMADTVIVGRFVGEGALAAVGSTGTVMFLLMGFAVGITSGFSIPTSQYFGAGDKKGVRQTIGTGTLLTIIIAVLMTIISTMMVNTLLTWMNTPSDILADAKSYLSVICSGLSACIFYNLFSGYLRAVGNSKAPLFFLVFSSVLNIILDLIFILNLHLGVAGAALATVLSQGISAVLCVVYILFKVKELVPDREQWKIDMHVAAKQMKMGIPMALQFAITASGTMIMQTAINLFGSTAVAAFTAAAKVQNLLTQGMLSMGQTMATYCGQNYGSGDVNRLKTGVKRAVQVEVIYSLLAALLFYLLLPNMVALFFSGDTSIAELLPWARTYATVSMIFYIPLSFIFIFRSAMEGCGSALLVLGCGIVEFVARCLVAFISMQVKSFLLAVACDPAAWLAAAIFSVFAFHYVLNDVERKLAGKNK